MSHFASLCIITPQYKGSLDESLEKYDENRSVPEYIDHEVSDKEKVDFLAYYADKDKILNIDLLEDEFVSILEKEGKCKTLKEIENEWGNCDRKRYCYFILKDHEQEYADWFKAKYPELWDKFEETYKEKAESWNANGWRINPETGKWCDYSTYNPDSVYDYYMEGWECALKTKSGEYVDSCLLGEIDWSKIDKSEYNTRKWEKDFWGEKYHPFKKGHQWRFNEEDVPSYVFIDGNYYHRATMGWWAIEHSETMTEDEWKDKFFELIKDLDPNSEVHLLNMHI